MKSAAALLALLTGCAGWSVPSGELVAPIATQSAPTQRSTHGMRPGATRASGVVGVANYGSLKFRRQNSGETATTDFSTLPMLGFTGQYALAESERADFGFDGGILLSGWYDDATIRGVGNTIVVSLDQRLILTDIFCGAYASTQLGTRARVFAGAGPLLLFGHLDTETESGSGTDSSFSVGAYARGGLQMLLEPGTWFGLHVRAMYAELRLDEHQDEDLNGVQVMLAVTKEL